MSRHHEDITRRQILRAGLSGGTAIVAGAGVASSAEHASGREFTLDSEARLLSASDIRAKAVGNTLVGFLHDGEHYELYLRPDGTAFLRMEGGRFETGTWELSENGWITSQWPTIAQGKQLQNRYYRTGPGKFSNLEASSMRWSRFTIEPGDSRSLDG